jgi:divalent metal cation (Fe/Co/Zn/Cd) transporter
VGFYAKIWWLDALGGLLLSLVVIFNWSRTSSEHIKHLSGCSASADQRNIREFLASGGPGSSCPPVGNVPDI